MVTTYIKYAFLAILLVLNCSNAKEVDKLFAKYGEIEKAATSNTVTLIAKSFTGGYMGYSVSDKIDKAEIEECLASRKQQRDILSELASMISEPVVIPMSEQGDSVKVSPAYLDSLVNVNEQRTAELTKLLNWYELTQGEGK